MYDIEADTKIQKNVANALHIPKNFFVALQLIAFIISQTYRNN